MKVFKLFYPRCMDLYSYYDRTLIYNIPLLNYFCFVMHSLDDINSIVSFIRYIYYLI